MEPEVLLEHENLKIDYFQNGNYILETWWGSTIGNTFPELLEKIVEILLKKKIDGLILDAREHKGLSPTNQELAAKRIGETAHQLGQLRQAIVVPKDVFSKFSVENFEKKLSGDETVITMYFDDVNKAKEWMEQNK
jgi:hypothetical protein